MSIGSHPRRAGEISIDKRFYVAGCLVLVMTSGCGGGANSPETVQSAGKVPKVSQSKSPNVDSAAAVRKYVEAVASNDVESQRGAISSLTEAGSPAAAYLAHLANVNEAALDGGSPYDPSPATAKGKAWQVCDGTGSDQKCLLFANWKATPSGKLATFTINDLALEPRIILGDGTAVTNKAGKFTLLTAYKSVSSNALVVSVKVESLGNGISLNSYSATYRAPDGKQRKATDAQGPTELAANSNTVVAPFFVGVQPGGTMTLDGCVGSNCNSQYTVTIKVG